MVRESDQASDVTFIARSQQEGVRTTKNNSKTPKLCQRPVGFTHLDSSSLGRFQRLDGQDGARAGFTKDCRLTAPLESFWKADWSPSAVWWDMIGGVWGKRCAEHTRLSDEKPLMVKVKPQAERIVSESMTVVSLTLEILPRENQKRNRKLHNLSERL